VNGSDAGSHARNWHACFAVIQATSRRRHVVEAIACEAQPVAPVGARGVENALERVAFELFGEPVERPYLSQTPDDSGNR
jgi:hypothetical protein